MQGKVDCRLLLRLSREELSAQRSGSGLCNRSCEWWLRKGHGSGSPELWPLQVKGVRRRNQQRGLGANIRAAGDLEELWTGMSRERRLGGRMHNHTLKTVT